MSKRPYTIRRRVPRGERWVWIVMARTEDLDTALQSAQALQDESGGLAVFDHRRKIWPKEKKNGG